MPPLWPITKISSFYEQLEQILHTILNEDKIVLLRDFTRELAIHWLKVLGKFRTGKTITNRNLLLSICKEHLLVITNTNLKHSQIHKNWMQPRSKHWHLIDYIITQLHDLLDSLNLSAMGGVNCSIDHVMIKSTTKLRVRRRKRIVKMPVRKITVNMIKITRVRDEMQASLNDKVAEISAGIVKIKWNAFKSIVHKASKEKLGTVARKHVDWFERNSLGLEKLINNRNRARNNLLSKNTKSAKARYRTCCQLLWQGCRELKNKWWLIKEAKILTFANCNFSKAWELWTIISHWQQTRITEKHELLA